MMVSGVVAETQGRNDYNEGSLSAFNFVSRIFLGLGIACFHTFYCACVCNIAEALATSRLTSFLCFLKVLQLFHICYRVCWLAAAVFLAALLAYRTWPFSKPVNKLVHILWHVVAVTAFSIGLSAVWR